MAYQTIAQARAREDLNIADDTDYPDAKIQSWLNQTTAIVDTYLCFHLELDASDVTDIAYATPMSNSGLHILLPKRFIVSVTSVTVKYGYGQSDLEIPNTSYQIISQYGIIKTSFGANPNYKFGIESHQDYQVEVVYKAGLDSIPDDFIEAFYAVMKSVMEAPSSEFTEGDSQASNKIQEHRTLNETIKYALNYSDSKGGDIILDNWVASTLDKYRMPKKNMGVTRKI